TNSIGAFFLPGSTFVMGPSNATLYAVWSLNYNVTYNGNGASGGSVPVDNNSYLQGQTVTVQGNNGGLVNTGSYFIGWNTKPDGTGVSYLTGIKQKTSLITKLLNGFKANYA